ncbi:MAG: 8-amino-7-oxononanoate synthase [Saprospiraceae bacterium]|nr:8-amino-7-oxononanoate synthase [Saprospiraceae bacterium]
MSLQHQILAAKLFNLQQKGLLRKLPNYEGMLDLCSNDYLGFSRKLNNFSSNEELSSGATGSRLISGNSTLAEATEDFIANFHGEEASLIYNSGYMANVGLLSCLGQRGDAFLYDELVHASIHDGMRLSFADRYKFKHNDIFDLEKKLQHPHKNKFVIIESIYSMDGDMSKLDEIYDLCQKYQAALIVDEAHSIGIMGSKGDGLTNHYHLQNKIFARIVTFGKAMGLHGAAVLGSQLLKDYLINHSRPFIYTTALPPHTFTQLQSAYQLLEDHGNQCRTLLFENIQYFRKKAAHFTHFSWKLNDSPIQCLYFSGNAEASALAHHFQQHKIAIKAILAPTVQEGTERIRICLHAHNSSHDIDYFFETLQLFKL